ncbi:PREDICTED: uncharacterized protein LOC18594408 [Theobroma cacao]|uniref:Uncharacterized protein LOC18594408 n=1 Tax=Theobroma cacao TaxID=3641 RepID=A0AB32WR36_THECC|nr:PREDICTED: uncharacterized protein LOC18594408 [Theobroma cacao]XP_017980341.1 PREDICTED: uncharacterized protein LOC18594408 [Theobroma cacao]
MLLIIACAIFFTEVKDAIFAMKSLRIKWQIRAMVVASLCVQLLLVKLVNQRRCSRKRSVYTATIVWLMYLFADWLATVSLSSLFKSSKEQLTSPLVVFWAPFLLLHLGGPDTITAYSLSENELWPRHFFGLCFQIGVALYVYVKFWTINTTTLTYLAIPIFIVGIIKYGERVWVLFSASDAKLRKSVFTTPTKSELELVPSGADQQRVVVQIDDYLQDKGIHRKYRHLHRASLSYTMFRPLFLDLKLRIYKQLSDLFTLEHMTMGEAFKLVEIELGFLYDLLYTKIPIVLSRIGVILRSICLSFLFSILIALSIIVGNHGYPKVDIAISYLLLVGAIFLEIYSTVLHVSSDRGILRLTCQDNKLFKAIGSSLISVTKTNRSEIQSMAQNSLIDYCLQAKSTKFALVRSIFDTEDFVGKYGNTSWKDVKDDLKKFIYDHLLDKWKIYKQNNFDYKCLMQLLSERGHNVLLEKHPEEDLGWSICDVEFTQSLLIWHIATDLVFRVDHPRGLVGTFGPYCKISKLLSDYMMYLLFMSPTTLPQGIIKVRLQDTCAEAMSFFHGELDHQKIVETLFRIGTENRAVLTPMGTQTKSVFFEGCQIARQLQELVLTHHWDHEEKWEMIARIWLEMLTHAASECTWKEHAKQLKQGEELLTRVALLMAHFGLSKKIQMVDIPHELAAEGYQPEWDWDNLDRLAYYLV